MRESNYLRERGSCQLWSRLCDILLFTSGINAHRGERPDGRPAEQAQQSVADAAVGSQTFSGSFNISGVIAATVQCPCPPGSPFKKTKKQKNGVLCWWHWLNFLLSLSLLAKLISINCNFKEKETRVTSVFICLNQTL